MPAFSIITPTYNRGHLIGETIASVCAQTFGDFEWLIIDDGSTDNTREIIASVADSRIKYLSIPHSGHLSRVRNAGLVNASGSYIAHLDSDDLWHPEKLDRYISLYRDNPDVDLIISGYRTFGQEGKPREDTYASLPGMQDNVSRADLFSPLIQGKMFVYPSSLSSRRTAAEQAGLLDETLVCADIEYIVRLADGRSAIIIHEPLVFIREHDGKISRNSSFSVRSFDESIQVIDRYYRMGRVPEDIYRRKRRHYVESRDMWLSKMQAAP